MVKERTKPHMAPDDPSQPGYAGAFNPMGNLESTGVPTFSHIKGDMEKAAAIANWVLGGIKDENWGADESERNFAQRTPREILVSRTRGFVGFCLENTVAANAIFMNEGFKTTIVTEEVVSSILHRNRLHFVLEFETGDGTYHLDFLDHEKTYLLSGRYEGIRKDDDVSLSIRRVDGSKVGLDAKPFEAMFGITSPSQLGTVFKHYTEKEFRGDIEGIRRDREKITAAFREHQGRECVLITEPPR